MAEASVAMQDVYNWVEFDARVDTLRLADPQYGCVLDPALPPPSVQAALGDGLEFWKQNASNIRLTNFYARHGSAADLDERGSFESHMRQYPYFGYESYGSSARVDAHARQLARIRGDNGSFQHRLFRSIVTAPRTVSMPMDARRDGTAFERALISAEDTWGRTLDSPVERALGGAVLQNMRDWTMLAVLGRQLGEHVGGRLRTMTEIATLAGPDHQDLTRKAQCLKVATRAVLVNAQALTADERHPAVVRVARTGVFNPATDS